MAFQTSGYEETLSANGQTTRYDVVGQARVTVVGTFGGGTAVVQALKQDGSTWEDIPGTSTLVDMAKAIFFPPDSYNSLRVSLSGATTPSLKVTIQGSSRIKTS